VALRIGIDLVRVSTVQDALDRHGERYLARVYTPAEVEDCRGPAGVDPLRLAARFAAKEAAMKTLRVGDAAVPWPAVEVRREPGGAPALVLHGPAAALAEAAGIAELALSFTHEHEYAGAVVVAEMRPSPDQGDGANDRSS
jgi:holo-[acyl-carrier protein] synthase